MTEDEARAALRAFVGDIEQWIAAQPWEAIPEGWIVRGHGWRLRVEPVAGGLRVVMSVRGGEPVAWVVPAGP